MHECVLFCVSVIVCMHMYALLLIASPMVLLVLICYPVSEMYRLAIHSESKTISEMCLHLIVAPRVIRPMQLDGGARMLLHLIKELKNHA